MNSSCTLDSPQTKSEYLNDVISKTMAKNPNEPEFLQAVKEVLS